MANNRTSTGGLLRYFLRRWVQAVILVALLTASPSLLADERNDPKLAKFAFPVWHPDARWEVEEIFAGSSAPGFLDGPRRQSQPFAGKVDLLYGPTQGGRNLLLSYDSETEMAHIVAGSARGYQDVKVSPVLLHDSLLPYLKKHTVISPRREGRAYATDLAPVIFSQDAVVSDGSRGSYGAWER